MVDAVDDYGLEVIRKAAQLSADSTKYDFRTVAGVPAGAIDDNNSSTTPLADAAVYTGTGVDVSSYSVITVFVTTDLDGTLSMQLSSDGTNWDRAKVVEVDQTIGTGSVHTLAVAAKFFRVVYTNSTGNGTQSYFRLQTIFHTYKAGFLSSSPDEIISKTNDAQLIRITNDPQLDIARGLYKDKEVIRTFGHHTGVPSGTYEDIWSYGTTDGSYNWPTTSEKFRVKAGGNVNDTAAGTGARTIQILYLDSLGNRQQDTLTLAGALASDETSVTGRRVLRAWVDTVGTINGNNTGNIIIENETANEVVAFIAATVGETQLSQFTVPLGYTGYIRKIELSIETGSNKVDADVQFWQRRDAYTTAAPFGAKRLMKEWNGIQGYVPSSQQSLPSVPALTDLWFAGQGNGAISEIDVDYEVLIIKDETGTTPQ